MYLAERGHRRMGYEYGVRDGYHGRVAQEQASLGYGMFLHNHIFLESKHLPSSCNSWSFGSASLTETISNIASSAMGFRKFTAA